MLLGRVRSRRAVVLPRSDRHYYEDDDNYYDYDNYNYQSADRALRRSAEIAPTLRLRVHRVEAVRRWRMLLAAVDLARRSVVLPRPRVSARLRPDAVASPGVRLHRHRRRAVRGEGVLLGRLIRLRSNQVLPPQLRSVARTSYRPIGRYRRSRHRNTHTHPFNGPFSRTTRVGRYQKGKTNLDFTEARDGEWQLHQLGICKSDLAPDR